jgi:hypothetical protein
MMKLIDTTARGQMELTRVLAKLVKAVRPHTRHFEIVCNHSEGTTVSIQIETNIPQFVRGEFESLIAKAEYLKITGFDINAGSYDWDAGVYIKDNYFVLLKLV